MHFYFEFPLRPSILSFTCRDFLDVIISFSPIGHKLCYNLPSERQGKKIYTLVAGSKNEWKYTSESYWWGRAFKLT